MNPMKRLMKMTLLQIGMLYSLRDEQDNYVMVIREESSHRRRKWSQLRSREHR